MKRHLMPVFALAETKRILAAIFCLALLMFLTAPVSAAQEEDPCNSPTIGTTAIPVGSATGCGVLITITGTSGQLTATVTGGGTANGNPYDKEDDELVGVQNLSSVTIGAIRLSAPPLTESSTTDNLFFFDGDGPCNYAIEINGNIYDCFAGDASSSNPYDYEGPNNTYSGISPDYTTGTISFVTPIPPGGSTWFGLENTPAAVVSIGETQPLVTGTANVFPFGPFICPSGCGPGSGVWTEQSNGDDLEFTPVSGVTGLDYWTFLPLPLCAGPVGESPFGPFVGTPSFGFAAYDFGLEAPSGCPSYGPPPFLTNFSVTYPSSNSLACIPYSDYSSPNEPICVELERDCSGPDCTSPNLQWIARLDYDLDPDSIAGPIGGPAILFAPGIPGPTTPTQASENPFNPVLTDFSVNAITAYTGLQPGEDAPPAKAGGTDGKSVFVSAFSPAQSETNPIPPGVTVGFPGFEVPSSNISSPSCTPVSAPYLLFPSGKQVTVTAPANCLLKVLGTPVPWALVWDYTTTANTPITTLQLCPSDSGGTCTGVTTPWVHLSLVPVAGCGTFTGQNPLLGVLPKLAANFVNLGKGQYSFAWAPGNNPKGCTVSPVLQFSDGTIASPATFVYSY